MMMRRASCSPKSSPSTANALSLPVGFSADPFALCRSHARTHAPQGRLARGFAQEGLKDRIDVGLPLLDPAQLATLAPKMGERRQVGVTPRCRRGSLRGFPGRYRA